MRLVSKSLREPSDIDLAVPQTPMLDNAHPDLLVSGDTGSDFADDAGITTAKIMAFNAATGGKNGNQVRARKPAAAQRRVAGRIGKAHLREEAEMVHPGSATLKIKELLDSLRRSDPEWPEQYCLLEENAARVKQLLLRLGDASGLLSSEHPLVTTYISSCQNDLRMIYISSQVANLGYAPENWLGKTDLRLELVHPEDKGRVEQALHDSLDLGNKFNCQYRLCNRNGNFHWIHDEASIVSDDDGVPVFIRGAMLDITAQKNMEEELRQYRYQLERQVAWRTERMARRIAVLESCNQALSSKLDIARQGGYAG